MKIKCYYNLFCVLIFCWFLLVFNGCAYKDFKKAQQAEETGDYLKAAKLYQLVISRDYNNTKAYLGLADALYALSLKRGTIDIFKEQDWSNAAKSLEIALQLTDKNNDKRKVNQFNIYKILSAIYIRSEKIDQAEKILEKALELFNTAKTDPEIYFNLAFIYGKKNQQEKEIDFYKKALELNPNFTDAAVNLAVIYKKINLFDEAIKYLKPVINKDTVAFQPELQLIDVYIAANDLENAQKIIDTINPENIKDNQYKSELFNKKAVISIKRKQYVEALEHLKAALKYNFWNVKVRINSGILFYEKQEFETALSEFNSAIEQDNYNPDLYIYRGLCLTKLARYKDAITDFNRALTLNPKNPIVYKNLSIVYNDYLKDANAADFYKKKYDELK